MTTMTSRRAILAGAAAIPVTALASSTPALSKEPDPIFVAIERHRVRFHRRMETGELSSRTPDFGPEASKPENIAIHEAADKAMRDNDAAAMELADTQPTTMAGILALIDYVEAFNQGEFRLNDDWYSAPFNWPSAESFDFETDTDEELGMAYAVLLNIRDALKTVAA